ncbi:MAG: DUF1566 domain-containing protein [Bradymonadales bacterium]|nr:DUF1566 domain-containing protein [Bradymonadales bacterium]
MKTAIRLLAALMLVLTAAIWGCGDDETGVIGQEDTDFQLILDLVPADDMDAGEETGMDPDVEPDDDADDQPEQEGDIESCPQEACEESLLCEEVECEEVTYYCTNIDGEWEWLTDPGCDDGEACTYDDLCAEGDCEGTEIACVSTDCLTSTCDGSDTCVETPLSNEATCGTVTCDPDYCDSNVFYDYPASCTRYCDGEGGCDSCSCTASSTTCTVGNANQCCTASCDSSTGCATVAGSCEDQCGVSTLVVERSCSGCGDNGAEGSCSSGSTKTCDAAHFCQTQLCGGTSYLCTNVGGSWQWHATMACDQSQSCATLACGATTYYCTNLGGSWQWRDSAACDDTELCTYGDLCSSSVCQGTPITCTSTDCMTRSCNGTDSCTETPLSGETPCGTNDCDPDYCDTDVFFDYPASCTSNCDGEGGCDSCSCTATPTTCSVGDTNQCCVASCDSSTGCSTVAGSCADQCDASTLTTGKICNDCGANGANGTCSVGSSYGCDSTSFCSNQPCGGTGYYCTNASGTYQWETSTACDDGDPCTENDSCGADGCKGTPKDCGTGNYCLEGFCEPCDTDQHCGESCVDCTGDGLICNLTGDACVECNFRSDCQPGEVCYPSNTCGTLGIPCTVDSTCTELGLICNQSWGICVFPTCEGQEDFILCETETDPDRSYDICINQICVSPGCGDATCNVPGPHFPQADTNQRVCYDNDSVEECTAWPCNADGSPDFCGQDAQYGWDTINESTDRFTRDLLSVSGNPMVADNVTGLIWQGCVYGLSGDDCSFGSALGTSWAEQIANCEDLDWGDHNDWRLPDEYELMSIVDRGRTSSPRINTAAFPNTPSSATWVSSSRAGAVENAWTLNFSDGMVSGINKEQGQYYARCLRGPPTPRPPRFTRDIPDETPDEPSVYDSWTGLQWQGCSRGQTGETCATGSGTTSDWKNSLSYCEKLSWSGHDDWRLPSIFELMSITNQRSMSYRFDHVFFPNTPSYWEHRFTTSSSSSGFHVVGLIASAGINILLVAVKKTEDVPVHLVRCVRDVLEIGDRCLDDSACESGVCHDSLGICLVASCEGQDDFTLCRVVTEPDRSYDICVDQLCVSPGCGDASCNVPGPHFPLADTNQRSCYDSSALMTSCPEPGQNFHGQDAQYGWDTIYASTTRYTRDLSTNGEPLVTDNVTGLNWQGCTRGQTGDDCLGGSTTSTNWPTALAYCDGLSWGGLDDWRLPDPVELMSIVDLGATQIAYIDQDAFPNTTDKQYWASSTRPTYSVEKSLVDFGFGYTGWSSVGNLRVRCVSGVPTPRPPRFTRIGDLLQHPTVLDNQTGLTWQGCAHGQTGMDCTGGTGATQLDWQAALDHCEGLTWAEQTDWRLPSIAELVSILDTRQAAAPFLDPEAFPETPVDSSIGFWSSSTRSAIPTTAQAVDFLGGRSLFGLKTYTRYIRCVRGGPWD